MWVVMKLSWLWGRGYFIEIRGPWRCLARLFAYGHETSNIRTTTLPYPYWSFSRRRQLHSENGSTDWTDLLISREVIVKA